MIIALSILTVALSIALIISRILYTDTKEALKRANARADKWYMLYMDAFDQANAASKLFADMRERHSKTIK